MLSESGSIRVASGSGGHSYNKESGVAKSSVSA